MVTFLKGLFIGMMACDCQKRFPFGSWGYGLFIAQKGAHVMVHPSQERKNFLSPVITRHPARATNKANHNHFYKVIRFVLQPDKMLRPNLPGAFGAQAAQDMFVDLAVAAAGDIA